MARHWLRGLWIGALVGLVISAIVEIFGYSIGGVNANESLFPIYSVVAHIFTPITALMISSLREISSVGLKLIIYGTINILTYAVIGSLIGLIFKRKK